LAGQRVGRRADQLMAHAGGVGHRAHDVEGGADAQLAAHRSDVAHARVVDGGEHEADPGRLDAAEDALGGERDGHAEGLEHVGAAAARGLGAVAVLGNGATGSGHHQGRRGRDVEGAGAVAAGAAGVDRGSPEDHPERVVAHRLHHPGQLLDGLALDPQGGQESPHLGGGGHPLHDLVHHRPCGRGVEILPVGDAVESTHQRRGHGRRTVTSPPEQAP
jgi:hypothetical protein